jgi:phosphoglycolate phosphatase
MYKEHLFDLDGTLTDPKVGITKSVQYALNRSGIDVPDLEELVPFIGPPLANSFQELYGFDPAKSWEAVGYYREYFEDKGIFENIVYDGIPDLLETLQNEDKGIHVVTSKPAPYANRIVDHFGLRRYVKQVIGPELNLKKSTKGEMIERVLVQLPRVFKKDIVMIGDRKHDIIGAHQTGIDSIAVTYGHGSSSELTASNPTHLVSTVGELKTLLRN